uniref:Uncharacterized protein n=1 Tax=Arundo donax TaxID=35708 RepID=A0A0A9I2D3_ARUDO
MSVHNSYHHKILFNKQDIHKSQFDDTGDGKRDTSS